MLLGGFAESERKMCKGGKQSKQQFAVAFFVNAKERKELKPIVIRCNTSATWTSGEIMNQVLQNLSTQMKVRAGSTTACDLSDQ